MTTGKCRRAARSVRTLLVAATVASLLALVVDIDAGFDWSDGAGTQHYDGEPLGSGDDYPAATVQKTKDAFGLATDEEAKAKIRAFRKAIEKAIELIKKEDEAKGKCLEEQYKAGRLCADFKATNSNAAIQPDGTADCKNEPINIGVKRLPCAENFPCYDPTFYQTLSSLLHEATHGLQDYDPAPAGATDMQKAQERKKIAENEKEAEEAENALIAEVDAALAHVEAGNPVPANTPEPAKSIANSIVDDPSLTAQQKKDKAKELREALKRIKEGNDAHIECRERQIEILCEFIDGTGPIDTLDEVNEELKKTKWFEHFGNAAGGYGVVDDPAYWGGGGMPLFNQSDGVTTQSFTVPLQRIDDAELFNNGAAMLLVGPAMAPGLGALAALRDTNADGFFEQSTFQILHQSPAIHTPNGGLDLTIAHGTGQILVFNNQTNNLFRAVNQVPDTNNFPDVIFPAGVMNPVVRTDLVSIRIAENGSTVLGSNSVEIAQEVYDYSGNDAFAVSVFNPGPNAWLPAGDAPFMPNALFVPAFFDVLEAGMTSAGFNAVLDSTVEAWLVDENGIQLQMLGSAASDPSTGEAAMPFSPALADGDLLRLFDVTNGLPSVLYSVSGPAGPGDIVITEIMKNPLAVFDDVGEWFEIRNVSGTTVDLAGLTFSDLDFDTFTIPIAPTRPVGPGEYYVLGRNGDTRVNGGVELDYEYGTEWFLGNLGDEIIITDPDTTLIDEVQYDTATFPNPNGESMTLDPGSHNAISNDNGVNWCQAETPYGAGDLGTPGSANDFCDPCPWDVDNSGDVGFGDLTQLLINWGPCPPVPCPEDFDQSGDVGFNDLTQLLINWGPC